MGTRAGYGWVCEVASRHFWQPSTGVIWVEGLLEGMRGCAYNFYFKSWSHSILNFPIQHTPWFILFLCQPKQNYSLFACAKCKEISQKSVPPWQTSHGQPTSLPTKKLKSINSEQHPTGFLPNFFPFSAPFRNLRGFLWTPPQLPPQKRCEKCVDRLIGWQIFGCYTTPSKESNPSKDFPALAFMSFPEFPTTTEKNRQNAMDFFSFKEWPLAL